MSLHQYILNYKILNSRDFFWIFKYERKIDSAFLPLKDSRVGIKLNRCAVNWFFTKTGKLIKNSTHISQLLVQRQSGRMWNVLGGKILHRDSKTWTIQHIFVLFAILDAISRACLSDECRFLYIIYSLVIRRSLLAFFMHHSISLSSFLSHSLPCPLRPESCSCEFLHECKRRPRRLYELFQFTSANGESFLFFFFVSSFSYLHSFLFLSLSLYFTSVYVATSRIAEIPHLFSFSGAAGRAGRITRMRETAERKNSGRWMREIRAYSRLSPLIWN